MMKLIIMVVTQPSIPDYSLLFETWQQVVYQTAFEEAVGLLHTQTVSTALIIKHTRLQGSP